MQNSKMGGTASSPAKIILWGTGREYNAHLRRIQCGVALGEFEVVGVTSNDTWYRTLDGFRFILKEELMAESFDFVLVTSMAHWNEIVHEFHTMGGDREKLLPVDVLSIANLSFPQYVELYQSNLSIIASNCWGAVTYHALHMKFRSPFINIPFVPNEYLDLLRDFRHRMQLPLEYAGEGYHPVTTFEYPIFSLGGTHLYMIHSSNRAIAEAQWNDRVQRINYDNLFFMMYTEHPEIAEQFDALPYEKKICFTSFPSELSSVMDVTPHVQYNQKKGKPLWESVLGMASGQYQLYDVYELLMHGRKCYRAKA